MSSKIALPEQKKNFVPGTTTLTSSSLTSLLLNKKKILNFVRRVVTMAVLIAVVTLVLFVVIGVFGLGFAIAGALLAMSISIWVSARGNVQGDLP